MIPVFKFFGLLEPFGDCIRIFCFFGGVRWGLLGLAVAMPTGLEIWFNRGLVITFVGGVHSILLASGLLEGEELGVLSCNLDGLILPAGVK